MQARDAPCLAALAAVFTHCVSPLDLLSNEIRCSAMDLLPDELDC